MTEKSLEWCERRARGILYEDWSKWYNTAHPKRFTSKELVIELKAGNVLSLEIFQDVNAGGVIVRCLWAPTFDPDMVWATNGDVEALNLPPHKESIVGGLTDGQCLVFDSNEYVCLMVNPYHVRITKIKKTICTNN